MIAAMRTPLFCSAAEKKNDVAAKRIEQRLPCACRTPLQARAQPKVASKRAALVCQASSEQNSRRQVRAPEVSRESDSQSRAVHLDRHLQSCLRFCSCSC